MQDKDLESVIANDTYIIKISTPANSGYVGRLSIERKDGSQLTSADIPALNELGNHVADKLHERNMSISPGRITEIKLKSTGETINTENMRLDDIARLLEKPVEELTRKVVSIEMGKGSDDRSRHNGVQKDWGDQMDYLKQSPLRQVTARISGSETPSNEMKVVQDAVLGYKGSNPKLVNLVSEPGKPR